MTDATGETFDALVVRSERPVAVDFWAPWCKPCESVTRILEQLEHEHAERLSFVKLDIDANPSVASRYGVLSIPTVIVFEHGVAAAEVIGARSRKHFEQMLAPFIRS